MLLLRGNDALHDAGADAEPHPGINSPKPPATIVVINLAAGTARDAAAG
jgi:hypothetical protein